jgi:hypothetical protein
MKKIILFVPVFLLFLTGCSSDDAPTPPPVTQSFTFDNTNYSVLGSQGITEIKFNDILTTEGGVHYDRSTLSISGMNGFISISTISLDLYYKTGTSIAGTYTIDDDEDSAFEDFLSPLDRACMGWTTSAGSFGTGGSEGVQSHNPSGTIKVIVNSTANYTIQYTGDFKVYDGFDIIRNAPAVVNVTGPVDIQPAN